MNSSSTAESAEATEPAERPVAPMRERLLTAAMDLFGRQGYKATTIAQIEQAAGLSVGAGGIYRHFHSKRQLLEAGLARQVEAGTELIDFVSDPGTLAALPPVDRLLMVARAGLRRLEHERDVNRLLLRDLSDFPELLEQFRRHELQRIFTALTAWLRAQAVDVRVDVEAMAAVLIEAVSHYWVLGDIFGRHPLGIDEDRYLTTLAQLSAAALTHAPTAVGSPPWGGRALSG